ncbi:hypothetical protein C5L33_000240 [Lactobacillus pasteurii]|nr:hypothetical protein C5L33_000240 [Lactobacillus pasteurii]
MMKTTEEVKHDLAVEFDDLNGKISKLGGLN